MDRTVSQLSQETTDLPLSQETFRMLWDQLQDDATQGIVLQEPVQVDLANYSLDDGDAVIQQNQVEFHVEQLQMAPQIHVPSLSEFPSIRSENSFLAQLNSQLPPQLPPQLNHEHSPDSGNMPSSTGYASATDTTATPPPPPYTPPLSIHGQPQNILPSNTEYPGEYDFQINLGAPTSQATKSVSWTYSSILKKLFVDRDKPCPIQFKTSSPPPPNCYIRVLPIFKQAENLAEVVSRCPNHVGPLEDISANHLILCSDPNTQYFTDPSTGRHSLLVPYIMPQVGTEYSKFLFTFKCFISCVGGLNRRRIQLVFTLESESGRVLGRQVLDARVCACPGRDRKAEEKSTEKAKTPQKKSLKRGASKVTSTVGLTSFTKKKKQDDEIFHIVVQGREKYELLMKIKESLDLMDFVTPQQMSQCRQQQSALNQHVQLANGTPNLARVSSIQSSPPSTSNAIQNTPPPSMARSQSYPTQGSQPQLQAPPQQHQQAQQQLPPPQQFNQQQQPQGNMGMNPQYTTLNTFDPSTSIPSLQRHDTRICKDEADGPNLSMEVDVIPTSQGFGLPNTQLTPPVNQSQQDHSVFSWLSRIGLKEYTDVFQQKGVHSVTQLDEINMEDLAQIPHQPRETLWKQINEIKGQLRLDGVPSMFHTSSSASTASIHSSGGGNSQVYRATRFTLKQTLSFKVEKEDYDDCSH